MPGKVQAGGTSPTWPAVPPNLMFAPQAVSAVRGLKQLADQQACLLSNVLAGFDLPVEVKEVQAGPATTRIGFALGKHERGVPVRVSEIEARRKDLALVLGTRDLRIVLPLISAQGESLVGVEVNHAKQAPIPLGEAVNSREFRSDRRPLKVVMGMDVTGKFAVESLTDMPHLLVAGTTGSGKSVFLQALLVQLLTQYSPDELRLVLVDPKRIELAFYSGLPHLSSPRTLFSQGGNDVLFNGDDLRFALMQLIREMDSRYTQFQLLRVRDLREYNDKARAAGSDEMPYMVMVVDEFAELFDALGSGKEANAARRELSMMIKRIAQKARAAGIHLVFATQRPSVEAIKGDIKNNFPSRAAFRVPTSVDSEVVLDQSGAEILRGRGDMLYMSSNAQIGLQRLQGVYASTDEVVQVVDYWKGGAQASGQGATAP